MLETFFWGIIFYCLPRKNRLQPLQKTLLSKIQYAIFIPPFYKPCKSGSLANRKTCRRISKRNSGIHLRHRKKVKDFNAVNNEYENLNFD